MRVSSAPRQPMTEDPEDAPTVLSRLAADPHCYDDREEVMQSDLARENGLADEPSSITDAVFALAYDKGHSAGRSEVANLYPAFASLARLVVDTVRAEERKAAETEVVALRHIFATLPWCGHRTGCRTVATRRYRNAPGYTLACDREDHVPADRTYHPVEDLPCAKAVRSLRTVYAGE